MAVRTLGRRGLLSEGAKLLNKDVSLCLRGKAWNICPAAMRPMFCTDGSGTMSPYKVMVDDNFHYMAEDERWEYGKIGRAHV